MCVLRRNNGQSMSRSWARNVLVRSALTICGGESAERIYQIVTRSTTPTYSIGLPPHFCLLKFIFQNGSNRAALECPGLRSELHGSEARCSLAAFQLASSILAWELLRVYRVVLDRNEALARHFDVPSVIDMVEETLSKAFSSRKSVPSSIIDRKYYI